MAATIGSELGNGGASPPFVVLVLFHVLESLRVSFLSFLETIDRVLAVLVGMTSRLASRTRGKKRKGS